MVIANELHVLVIETGQGLKVHKVTRDEWLKVSATLKWSRPEIEDQPVWVKHYSWISTDATIAAVTAWLHEQKNEVVS